MLVAFVSREAILEKQSACSWSLCVTRSVSGSCTGGLKLESSLGQKNNAWTKCYGYCYLTRFVTDVAKTLVMQVSVFAGNWHQQLKRAAGAREIQEGEWLSIAGVEVAAMQRTSRERGPMALFQKQKD